MTICKCPLKRYALYNFVGLKPRFCRSCKSDGMEDVMHKKCMEPECTTIPSYGIERGKSTHCQVHASDDMEDVVHKRCIVPECMKRSYYGFVWMKPTHCQKHATTDMENVTAKQCAETGCTTLPSYGNEWLKPTHCAEHATADMEDVINKRCPGFNGVECPTQYRVAPGKRYCLACDPDDSRRLTRKKDEHAFFMFLKQHGIEVTQREYRIDYQCVVTSKTCAIIDGIIVTPEIVICLEVDEHAHTNYSCDEARTNDASTELLLAYPNHHIAWVRWRSQRQCHPCSRREISGCSFVDTGVVGRTADEYHLRSIRLIIRIDVPSNVLIWDDDLQFPHLSPRFLKKNATVRCLW